MIEVVNQFGEAWARYFGLAVAQNTLFLGLVFLALYLMRHASARIKYVIGMIGLLKLLLPPFIPVQLAPPSSGSLSSFTVLLSPNAQSPIVAGSEMLPTAAARLDLAGLFFLLWLVIAGVYIVSVLVSTLRLRIALRDALPVNVSGGRVPVYRTDRICVPLTIGVFPKRIFVPAAWDGWNEECRQMVIRHERAHIVRRDGMAKLVQVFMQALYWFHPLAWILSRRLETYREMACDDASTGPHKRFRLRYSKYLVEIAETVAPSPVTCESASTLIRRKNELLSRIEYQIKEVKMSPISKKRAAVMLAAVSLLTLPLSTHFMAATGDTTVLRATGSDDSQSGLIATSDSKQFIGVFIENADDILINGERTALSDFQRHVESVMTTDNDNVIINMACGGNVTMGTLFSVQRVMIDMGLMKVNYENAMGKGMPLALPPEGLKARMADIPSEFIAILRVTAKGDVFFEEQPVEMSQVKDSVKERLAQNDKLIVSIHTEKKTSFKNFLEALDQVKMADAPRIFVNDPAI